MSDNRVLKYDSPGSEPVLRNINLQIQPGEKVAIVGRTGR